MCYAYDWNCEGRLNGPDVPSYYTHVPYSYPYTCAMWGESGGLQVKIQNLYSSTELFGKNYGSYGRSTGVPVLEIPTSISIVPFDDNEQPWESAPLVSDGRPCPEHGRFYNEDFDVLSLYRIEPRAYESVRYLKDAFYYPRDYSNILYPVTRELLDRVWPANSTRERAEELKNASYDFFWGFTTVVLPKCLKHIADSACVGVVTIETPLVVTENVEYIGDMAFCCGDFDVDMSEARSLTHIGIKAMYATAAKEIVLPESVKEVGELAFGPSLSVVRTYTYVGVTACWGPPTYTSYDYEYLSREYEKDVSYQTKLCLERVVLKNPTPPAIVREYRRDATTGELTDEPVREEPILCHDEFAAQIPLYVPDNAVEAYRAAPGWKHFTQIYPISELSGIDDIVVAGQPAEIGRYDLNGRPVDSAYRGITVVKYSDGTAKKEMR